jgi:hypothetical protein
MSTPMIHTKIKSLPSKLSDDQILKLAFILDRSTFSARQELIATVMMCEDETAFERFCDAVGEDRILKFIPSA